jgi:hypothetical protein
LQGVECLIEFPLAAKSISQVIEDVGHVRVPREARAQSVFGVGKTIGSQECTAMRGEEFRVLCMKFQAGLENRDGLRELPLVLEDDSKILRSGDNPRRNRERFAIGGNGFIRLVSCLEDQASSDPGIGIVRKDLQ